MTGFDMDNEWLEFEQYPGYSISRSGSIKNNLTGRLMKRGSLVNGAPAVSLYVGNHYVRRQVSSFMAETWMEPPQNKWFNTIVHLDGDRDNCHVNNLVWRPRWFAIRYHKECSKNLFPDWTRPFRIVETNDVFSNPRECSRVGGFLQGDIVIALFNNRPLFPGAYTLEYV